MCQRLSLGVLLLITNLVSSPVVADDNTALFRQALAQAEQQDWRSFDKTIKRLPADFVLHDYLAQLRIEKQPARLERQTLERWQARYPDSPLRNQVLQRSLFAFARQKNWSDYLAFSPEHPATPELRCLRGQALIHSDDHGARPYAEKLWLEGRSQPGACDPVFSWLKKQGYRTDDLIWQRFLLAFEANNITLMKYLRGQLKSATNKKQAERALELAEKPERVKYLFAGDGHSDLALHTLQRLASREPEDALRLVPLLSKRFDWGEPQRRQVHDRIAWHSVIREEGPNRAWLDQYLTTASEQRTLEQRVRRALIEEDWERLDHWIGLLPAQEQGSARWQYWLAQRASRHKDAAAAKAHLSQAAGQRSFWGFLAAEALGLPHGLNRTNTPKGTDLTALKRPLERIALLQDVGLTTLARQEWLHLLRRSEPAQLEALANHAAREQWHNFAIEAAIQGRFHDVLVWRFPLAFREDFIQAEKSSGVDQWLLMAVARRESAFNPEARSHAGALGLMQVMPATAAALARSQGWPAPSRSDLLKPLTSLQYGSRYLSQMLERYQGNRVLALAAYNAGPHRADRWIRQAPRSFDLFIEAIPFYETREYVQAVLAYRVILAHQAGLDDVTLLSEAEKTFSYFHSEATTNAQ